MQDAPLSFLHPTDALVVSVINLNTHKVEHAFVPMEQNAESILSSAFSLAGQSFKVNFVSTEDMNSGTQLSLWPSQDAAEEIWVDCDPSVAPACIGFATRTVGSAIHCLGLVPKANGHSTVLVDDVLYHISERTSRNDVDEVERLIDFVVELGKSYHVIAIDFPRTSTYEDLPQGQQTNLAKHHTLNKLLRPFVPALQPLQLA